MILRLNQIHRDLLWCSPKTSLTWFFFEAEDLDITVRAKTQLQRKTQHSVSQENVICKLSSPHAVTRTSH